MSNIELAIEEYLKDKSELRSEHDSINYELFSSGDISAWRFQQIPAPSMEELQSLLEAAQARISQEKINAESLQYLVSTDWMILREMDEGTPCPPEIKAERAAARARIIK